MYTRTRGRLIQIKLLVKKLINLRHHRHQPSLFLSAVRFCNTTEETI
jgi:hypothetical protein